MAKLPKFDPILVAPCGMNCALCSSYLSQRHDLRTKGFMKTYCPGCRPRGKNCAFMKKNCALIGKGMIKFCHECKDFPCKNLRHLDERYRTKYRMSMIENLELIRKKGMKAFLSSQKKAWTCPKCGDVICCHNGFCYSCSQDALKRKKKKYQWSKK